MQKILPTVGIPFAVTSLLLFQELAFAQKGEGQPLKVKPRALTLSTSGECSTTDEDAGRGSRAETWGTQSSVAAGNAIVDNPSYGVDISSLTVDNSS